MNDLARLQEASNANCGRESNHVGMAFGQSASVYISDNVLNMLCCPCMGLVEIGGITLDLSVHISICSLSLHPRACLRVSFHRTPFSRTHFSSQLLGHLIAETLEKACLSPRSPKCKVKGE